MAATGRCYRKRGQRLFERTAVTFRVEPARAELAPQPGDLALGQLAGGEDRTIAEGRRVGEAIQVLPGLAVADGAQRRQLQRRRVRCECRPCPQGAHLVEETLFQHRSEEHTSELQS